MKPIGLCLFVVLSTASTASMAQQIAIPRIEQMPNLPAPYDMRDWRQVAIDYDAFVYDLDRSGTYLPLIWINNSTVNYPDHESFGLETVVGTPRFHSGEAINVLPSMVGASLAGIDKSEQNGFNWVLMAEEFFNRRPEENVYLNLPVTQSGDDWWYETMPNVFFYQLYDLYRGTGDFENQFTTVAEQFLSAVRKMGWRTTPWTPPNMNYRAWSFSAMKPLVTGVKEPEAAGAIAWLLYNAYTETNDDRYRQGAEAAMEFLSSRTSNPSYELQLPYGVYMAARMNAELGTDYDLEKMVNWCFDVGPLRNWGSLVGNWGGYDAHGLIGEESFNDYAFLMNGFEQAGALAPMTRYDNRFARAIGKWILNLANASRLFYPKYLPATNQDSEEWSFEHDPGSVIGHEALRQERFGFSPYATGDAIAGGWGFTNLALYGSSHVGMLGGILDTTDVEGILKLDVRKTDFFAADGYPTYLLYNPHPDEQAVTVELGGGAFDLYDAVSNEFILNGATGDVAVSIGGDEALMLVLTPAGGEVTYDGDRLLVDGVVVDWSAVSSPVNHAPRIKALDATPRPVYLGGTAQVYCAAEDLDGDELSFEWTVEAGDIAGEGSNVTWSPPAEAGSFEVSCSVDDGNGGSTTQSLQLEVSSNHVPVIDGVAAEPPIVGLSETAAVSCSASDGDDDPLTYDWEADAGAIEGEGSTITWHAPDAPGYATVRCRVEDPTGASAVDSAGIVVGDLVGYYPFNGNALDESGFGNNAVIKGAILVDDADGNPHSAFYFDGVDDALVIPSHPSLDFSEAMTVALWFRPDQLLDREEFLISHGSWQNRWKLSIVPDHHVRWTVKSGASVKDLDSKVIVAEDSLQHVAATYGDGALKIYVDGLLDNEAPFSGPIAHTDIDLTVGQMVPGNVEWNFNGVIDDIRVYNRVLDADEIAELVGISTDVEDLRSEIPSANSLKGGFPNPFVTTTTILYEIAAPVHVRVEIFDVVGRRVRRLYSGDLRPGLHRQIWNGRDDAGSSVAGGVYLLRMDAGGLLYFSRVVRL